MRCKHRMLLLAFLLVGLAGCGGSTGTSEDPRPADAETRPAIAQTSRVGGPAAGASEPIAASDTSNPAAAVTVFLDALRRGDDERILAMYTVRAREQATQLKEHFAPRGSDTARFKVGDVEYVADAGARVASTWTDLDQEGQPHTLEFLWMLRREPQGWRVAGMAATPFPGELPVVLDFENLEETIRRVNLLAEEIRRREEMGIKESQQAENSGDSLRR